MPHRFAGVGVVRSLRDVDFLRSYRETSERGASFAGHGAGEETPQPFRLLAGAVDPAVDRLRDLKTDIALTVSFRTREARNVHQTDGLLYDGVDLALKDGLEYVVHIGYTADVDPGGEFPGRHVFRRCRRAINSPRAYRHEP